MHARRGPTREGEVLTSCSGGFATAERDLNARDEKLA